MLSSIQYSIEYNTKNEHYLCISDFIEGEKYFDHTIHKTFLGIASHTKVSE